jgi:hypothetical protein
MPEDTIKVVYNGGMPELITAEGHTIIRGQPIDLPAWMAEKLLKARPEEFQKVEE